MSNYLISLHVNFAARKPQSGKSGYSVSRLETAKYGRDHSVESIKLFSKFTHFVHSK